MALTTTITKEVVKNAVKTGINAVNKDVVKGVVAGVATDTIIDVIKTKRAKGLPKTYENNTMKFMGKSDIITTTLEA